MHQDDTHATIVRLLTKAFSPVHLTVIDDSAAHAKHKAAQAHGGGHYKVEIQSDAFAGKPPLAAHRMVNAALKTLFDAGHIHALQIKAKS